MRIRLDNTQVLRGSGEYALQIKGGAYGDWTTIFGNDYFLTSPPTETGVISVDLNVDVSPAIFPELVLSPPMDPITYKLRMVDTKKRRLISNEVTIVYPWESIVVPGIVISAESNCETGVGTFTIVLTDIDVPVTLDVEAYTMGNWTVITQLVVTNTTEYAEYDAFSGIPVPIRARTPDVISNELNVPVCPPVLTLYMAYDCDENAGTTHEMVVYTGFNSGPVEIRLEYSADGGMTWGTIDDSVIVEGNGDVTNDNNIGLADGTYSYRARAQDSSVISNIVTQELSCPPLYTLNVTNPEYDCETENITLDYDLHATGGPLPAGDYEITFVTRESPVIAWTVTVSDENVHSTTFNVPSIKNGTLPFYATLSSVVVAGFDVVVACGASIEIDGIINTSGCLAVTWTILNLTGFENVYLSIDGEPGMLVGSYPEGETIVDCINVPLSWLVPPGLHDVVLQLGSSPPIFSNAYTINT